MASTYSTNLALELIGTGDQAGTWGTTTNTNLGTLLEQAISGYVTQAITDGADTTITIPNGASGVARNMFIECTGTLTAARNLVVPTNKKLYFIYNNTTGGYAVTVKVSGQTGVSVPNGAKYLLVSNGTDVVVANTPTNNLTYASEATNIVGTAAASYNVDASTSPVTYITATATGNWTVNFRMSSTVALNTALNIGQATTFTILATQGATAYYNNVVQVDGSAVTPKWQGGTAPAAGNASGIDVYSYSIIKTANATFTVLASQTQFK